MVGKRNPFAEVEAEAPADATTQLLEDLEKNPTNCDLLVTVLQTQIHLGLRDEIDALFAVEDWDDANEEDEDKEE